jgi:hypothetical protein
MKNWDNFYRDIMPHVTGCPEPMADFAILRAAQEFFKTTKVQKVQLDPITVRPDLIQYDIPLPPRVTIVQLESASTNGLDTTITTREALQRLFPDWQSQPQGIDDCIFTVDRKTIFVLPLKPALVVNSTKLVITASLSPSEKAEGIEDEFFELYNEIIANGALGRLMSQPKKPYSDPAEGMRLNDKFQHDMSVVCLKLFRGNSKTLPRRQYKTY